MKDRMKGAGLGATELSHLISKLWERWGNFCVSMGAIIIPKDIRLLIPSE